MDLIYYERRNRSNTKLYLVMEMKTRACILLVLWSTLLIEPLSANFNIESVYSVCAKKQKMQSSCCKSKCEKQENKKEKKDCENKNCNPLMSCPSGNFYLFNQSHLTTAPLSLSKERKALINDSRIVKQMDDCWHPPEII